MSVQYHGNATAVSEKGGFPRELFLGNFWGEDASGHLADGLLHQYRVVWAFAGMEVFRHYSLQGKPNGSWPHTWRVISRMR